MANEFIIKRGFESKGSSQVTGSLSVSSNIIADGTIAGSNISGTNTGDQDLSALASKTAISGSFVAPSSSFSTRVTFLEEGGAVGFTSSGISGSLGPNATLIRSLTATGISGSSTESSASFSTRVSSLETKSVFSGSLQGNGSAINSINASNISSGTIAAARVATLNQNTTGNAATATTLATARNINGVSFDGSADITTVEGNTGGTGATLTAITIGTTEFTVATGTGNGNVETSGTPLDNDYAKFTSGYQIEGRSTSEVKTDLSLNNVENTALSTYTGNGGALDNQYIANGRGFALKTAISGAFVASSASFSTRVTGNALGMSTNASNISSNTSNITSNRSLITGITSSLDTVGRMVFVGSNGTLTSEAGFAYNATTNQLSVDSLNVTHLTSSFITASNIKTSGSNIFGDSTSDTQTFIGTTFISGAAQITGSLRVSANIKSVGTVIGSNLSGTNTGDQDLSTLALKTAISGSFIAPSSSFSTRVTLNDAKLTANTTNVTSAGALMDSELAEIATVKSLTKAGISGSFGSPSSSFSTRVTFLEEGGAVGFTSSGISGSLGPNATLIRSLTAAKISGSFGAPSASFSTRVTLNDAKLTANTSNVTSAGALMDSELAEIATVKLLTKSGISGSFTELSASLADRAKFTSIWDVQSPSGGQYEFKGPGLIGSENKPALYLTRGEQYRFSINNASGHPFYIQTSAGAYNSGNVYNDGVTGNGTQSGNLDFNVQFDAPTTLYYVCSNHSGMGNIIYIDDFIPDTASTASYVAGANVDGAVATATLAADATTLATPRNINGVAFDGSQAITVTAAGSTLSDTVTVAKGGTGATSLTATRVLIGNGTSALATDSGFTYSSNVLTTEGLTITSTSAQNSETVALMINGSNVVGTRELGSNAFNSTAIPTAAMISGSFTELSASLSNRAKFTSIWDVVSPSGGQYEFKGPGLTGTENKPALYLTRGEQYQFNINASGHPFYIQTSAGAYNSGNVYNDGVTGNGTQVGDLDFNVQFDAPTKLYYVCSAHSGMGNIIYIDDFIPETAATASYVAGANVDGAVATATLATDATTLATPRAINGVNFDGSAPITITAAGSTLSDTVTVAKGGTGATSLTATRVLIGNGTSAVTTDSGFTYSSNTLGVEGLLISSVSAQNSEATSLMINGDGAVGTRELGSNAFNSTTIGTNTNALTVSTGLDLNSGTTFNGSAARTISVDVSDFMTNGSNNRVITATGADAMNAEANLTFDGSTLTLTGVLNIPGFSNVSASLAAAGTGTALTASYVAGGNVDGAVATATLAADATTLATPRAINGVNFDGSAPITITAAGSTLSDTVTVAKGGTGATTLGTNQILIGQGTSAVTTDSGFSYASNILNTEGLNISSVSAQSSEATSLMINGDGVVGTRELGSNAFNSTAIPTAAMISGSFTATSASFSTRVTANDAKLTANTSNVTSAGALMDSELTNLAAVKAINQSLVSGATPEFTTTNFTDASNKRLMTDAQETKLDSVETNADVTDTANVTSAGALMDSELTEIATVKTLSKSGISGSFTATSSSFSSRIAANEIITAKTLISGSSQILLSDYSMGTGLDTTGGGTGLALDLSEFTDMTGAINTAQDELILLDNGAERRKLFSEIFGSNAYNSTTIGTTTGALTVSTGLDLNSGTTFNGSAARTISVDVSDFMTNGANNRIVTATGTDAMNAEANLTFDGSVLNVKGVITGSSLATNGLITSRELSIISNASNLRTLIIGDISGNDDITTIKLNVYADDKIIIGEDDTTIKQPKLTSLSAQNSEATALMINSSNLVGTRELGSNAFNSTTIGTNTNALTVDNATVQLNSGTTFNGSAARTLSAKTAAIANGGTGLATADQIHTFVTTQTDAIDADTAGNAATATLAANSTLAGGLAIGTGRNDSANQIVRTQGNGYAEFGWINTTSGNTTSTITDVYVNTNDGYIRKATNAEFKSQLGIGTNTAALTVSTGLDLNSGTTFNGSAARTISVDVSDFMTNGSNNRIVTATGADAMNAESALTFDGSTLEVNGLISVGGERAISSSAGYLDIGQSVANSNSRGIRFYSDENLAMTIDTNSKVGIGTTSPDAVLNVISSTNNEEVLKIGNTPGNVGSTIGITHLGISHWDSGTHSSTRITATEDSAGSYLGSLSFGTRGAASDSAPTERMRILSGGNVGIGTTTPASKFHVSDAVDRNMNSSGTGQFQVSGNGYQFGIAIGSSTCALYHNSSARSLTLGTNETARLTIAGNSGNTTCTGTLTGTGLFAGSAGKIGADTTDYIAFTNNTRADIYINNSNEFRFESDGDFHADGDVIAQSTTISDSRLKDNILPIIGALDKIKSLRGVSYTWNAGKKKDKQDIGLIAQEVEKVIPEIVKDKKMPLMVGTGTDETYKTIDYEKIIAVLVEAVKDQQTQIDDLKKQIKK